MASTPALPASASVVVIKERDGGYYANLYGRAQPYRPVSFGGRQRVEFTWYPGSAAATTQPLGPEEMPIQMRGFWKDKFINDPSLPQVAIGEQETGSIAPLPLSVFVLTQHVDTMRRRGQLCVFSWDNLVRYGHITEFTQTWHNTHDCEWELTFTPSAQEDIGDGAPVIPVKTTLQQVYGNAVASLQSINTNLAAANAAIQSSLNAPFEELGAVIQEAQTTVALASNTVYNSVTGVAGNALALPQGIQRAVSALERGTLNILNTYATVADASLDLVFNFEAYGGRDGVPLAKQVAGFNWQRDAAQRYNAAAVQYATDSRALQETLSPELLGAFTARQDMDLRDVSSKYYGTPDYWGFLMNFNGLTSSKLTAGTVVFVPVLTQNANENTVPTNAGY